MAFSAEKRPDGFSRNLRSSDGDKELIRSRPRLRSPNNIEFAALSFAADEKAASYKKILLVLSQKNGEKTLSLSPSSVQSPLWPVFSDGTEISSLGEELQFMSPDEKSLVPSFSSVTHRREKSRSHMSRENGTSRSRESSQDSSVNAIMILWDDKNWWA